MAKASVPGRTKTRLVPPLSAQEAAAFNTAFLKDAAANLAAAARDADIRSYMAYGPPGSERFFAETLPPGIGLIEAWFANFGDCLFHAIDRLLADGHGSAVVLNSDSPTLPTACLVTAARHLLEPQDRIVLGPSTDGGYYLIGARRPHAGLFRGIDWSTERVAAQTRAQAAALGLERVDLDTWYDVDDAGSLRRLMLDLSSDRVRMAAYAAPFTSAFVQAKSISERLAEGAF